MPPHVFWNGVPLGDPEGNKPVLQADLSGRTVVLTGANVGLGFEAAKHFARMGPKRLILTARSEEKCRQVEEGALYLFSRTFAYLKGFNVSRSHTQGHRVCRSRGLAS